MIRLVAQRDERGHVLSVSTGGEPFPAEVRISNMAVAHADPRFVTVEGDTLTFHTVEGSAAYRYVEAVPDAIEPGARYVLEQAGDDR